MMPKSGGMFYRQTHRSAWFAATDRSYGGSVSVGAAIGREPGAAVHQRARVVLFAADDRSHGRHNSLYQRRKPRQKRHRISCWATTGR